MFDVPSDDLIDNFHSIHPELNRKLIDELDSVVATSFYFGWDDETADNYWTVAYPRTQFTYESVDKATEMLQAIVSGLPAFVLYDEYGYIASEDETYDPYDDDNSWVQSEDQSEEKPECGYEFQEYRKFEDGVWYDYGGYESLKAMPVAHILCSKYSLEVIDYRRKAYA